MDTRAITLRMDPCVVKMENYPREVLRLLAKYISPKVVSGITRDLHQHVAEIKDVIYPPTTDELWDIFSNDELRVGYWLSDTVESASNENLLTRNIFSVTGSGVGVSIEITLEGNTNVESFKRYPERTMTRGDFSDAFVDYVTLVAAILRRPRVRGLAKLYPGVLSNVLNAEVLAQVDVEYDENSGSRDELYAWSLVNLVCLDLEDPDVLVERPEIDISVVREQIREELVRQITRAVYSIK